QPQAADRGQDDKGERVYRILTAAGLPADCHVLVQRASRGEAGVRPGPDLVDGKQLQPRALQELARLLFPEAARLDVPAVKGIEVLVHSPQGDRMPVALDLEHELDEVNELECLGEVLRRSFRNHAAIR